MLALQDEFLEKFPNSHVESFCKAISHWIVCCGKHTLDSELVTESLECLVDELRPIIMDNLSWHAKVVDHVMFNELNHFRCFYLPQGDSFSPFEKIIDYG